MNYADLLDLPKQIQWRGWASIPRHPAYESGALPTELPRRGPETSLDSGWFTVHLFGARGFVSLGLMNTQLRVLFITLVLCAKVGDMMAIAGKKLLEVYAEFLDTKRIERRSANTFKQYDLILLSLFEFLNGDDLNRRNVDRFIIALMDGWHPADRKEHDKKEKGDSTIHKYARNITTFVTFAANAGHLDAFKVTKPEIRETEEKFALTMAQVDMIASHLDLGRYVIPADRKDWTSHATKLQRNKLAFWLVLETGCRVGEALAMTWDDIDLERGTVFIRAAKTKHNRYSALETLWNKAVPLLELEPDKTGPILRTIKNVTLDGELIKAKGSGLDYEGYRRFIATLNEHVDLGARATQHGDTEPVTFTAHDLRRTFITLALQEGFPVPVVAAQVGHTNWETTQLYDRTDVSQRVAIFKKHNGD